MSFLIAKVNLFLKDLSQEIRNKIFNFPEKTHRIIFYPLVLTAERWGLLIFPQTADQTFEKPMTGF